jgi:hypothetical protein
MKKKEPFWVEIKGKLNFWRVNGLYRKVLKGAKRN